MKRTRIVIEGSPGIVLKRVAPLFSTWLGKDGCVLGGGTVLASRWQHRVSTDIDLFTDHNSYRQRIVARRDEVLSALEQLVAETGEGSVEVERGWLRVSFVEGPATLMTIPRPTVIDDYSESAHGTNMPLESSAEILARKLQSRILDLGEITERDLYDFLAAKRHDPESLSRALRSVTAGERAAIASELEALPANWSSGEPVREPAWPDLVRNLARNARNLFAANPDDVASLDERWP